MRVCSCVWSESTQSELSLVVEHDVRAPDVVRGNVQHLDAPVLRRLPLQFVVVPELRENNQELERRLLLCVVELLMRWITFQKHD